MNGISLVLKLSDKKIGDIATILGVKQPQINAWMKDIRPIPTQYLSKLGEIFDVHEEFFENQLTETSIVNYYKKVIEKEIGKEIEIVIKI